MPHFSAANAEECKDIECAVCLEPWDRPVELQPCGHVFCGGCAEPLDKCPDCRGRIQGKKMPNRILVNMADAAEVKCVDCAWRGSREASRNHTQCIPAASQPPNRSLQTAPQPPPPQQPPQFQPPPQHHPQPMANPPMQPQQHQGGSFGPWSAYGLTQEQYDHIFMVFMTFDADDSGELDRGEITTLARWLNYAHTPRDIDAMFREMDTDGSGALSLDEFCRWVSRNRPDPQRLYGLTNEEYEATLFAFHSHDRDNNGLLDANEFSSLALRQGWARSPPEAQQLFANIDTDRNAKVDLDEILRFRQHQKRGGGGPPPPAQQQGGTPPPLFSSSSSSPPMHASGSWQQPPQPPQQQWQQPPPPPAQQHQWQHQHTPAAPLQPQQARTLDGRIVCVELGAGASGGYYVTVAPIDSAPQMFRSSPATASGPNGLVNLNADFSVPVYSQSPQDCAVFRVFRASDGTELCGATVRIADLPPANYSQPFDNYVALHPRDPRVFAAQGARIRLRLSMIG